MKTVTFSLATKDDLTAIVDLLTALFEQEADFEPDTSRQQRAVSDLLAHPEQGEILLARKPGRVIGMVSLLYLPSTAMGGRVALLEDMIIAADWRGQGYGQKLLSAAIDHARSRGCLRITLLTDRDNLPAQLFYQQQGFSLSAMVPMRHVLKDDF